MASAITHGGNGRVTLLDIKSRELQEKLSHSRTRGELKPRASRLLTNLSVYASVGGEGDLWQYARDFKKAYPELRRFVLKIGDALNMPFKRPGEGKRFNVIIDAGSHSFIISRSYANPHSLLCAYKLFSGKTILLTSSTNPHFHSADELKSAALAAGAKNVELHEVVNKYVLQTPSGEQSLMHSHNYDKALVVEW